MARRRGVQPSIERVDLVAPAKRLDDALYMAVAALAAFSTR